MRTAREHRGERTHACAHAWNVKAARAHSMRTQRRTDTCMRVCARLKPVLTGWSTKRPAQAMQDMQTGKRGRQLRPRCRIRLHAILSFERTVIRNAPRKTALVRFRVRRVATCVPQVPDQERHWMGLAGELTTHRRTNFRAQRMRRTSQDPQDRPAACKTGKGSFTSAQLLNRSERYQMSNGAFSKSQSLQG